MKLKLGDSPMKVPCSISGEIDEGYRVYVHRMFRAQARRFLKIEVIAFSDHPPEDVKTTLELIRMQFEFNPPLSDQEICNYLQKDMSACRYQWKKFWQTTGRGQKHEQCPAESFPYLVKYWHTTESEEESRALEQERKEARGARHIKNSIGETSQCLSADTWDVRY
ncbi:hypothetical protein M758_5G183900 [Ceratodon purpureus]|nr:hypothetical protein M758_5G183900 [Ceratodon purpureus]